jgi:hypothetical protein
MTTEITYEIISVVPAPDIVAWQQLEDGTYERLVGPVILQLVRYMGDSAHRGQEVQFSVKLNGDPQELWCPEPWEEPKPDKIFFLPRDQKPSDT